MGPLESRRILVSRAEGDSDALAEALAARGAWVVCVPLIRIEPPEGDDLAGALASAGDFDGLVITSPNGADAVAKHRSAPLPPVASVGPATTRRLNGHGIEVALDPRQGVATGRALAEELIRRGWTDGRHLLLARGDRADGALPDALEDAGARVSEVTAYRTLLAGEEARPALDAAVEEGLGAITLTSGSTAEAWIKVIGAERARAVFAEVPAVAIGPQTTEIMRRLGLSVAAVAKEHTIEGLVDAVVEVIGDQ